MKPVTQNFTRVIGDNYPLYIKLGDEYNIGINILGSTITLKIQQDNNITSIFGDIISPETGEAEIPIESGVFTSTGIFKYEIEFVSQYNIKYTIANGTFDIVADLG